jgi:nicotinamide-nucleotide amidase
MKAEILSIGTEILLGEITDTNAAYLAGQLPVLGIDLYFISQFGDNQGRLVEALRRAWQRSDIILLTGGLGPTDDDITRESIAEMMGEEMYIVPEIKQALEERFARRGTKMAVSNLKQAKIIASGKPIPNARGTAPGWWVEKDEHVIIAMPGPPGEMQLMWQQQVLPQLLKKTGGSVLVSRTIKLHGIAEGTVGEMVRPYLNASNPTMGIYAKLDGIHLRFGAKAPSRDEAVAMIAKGEAEVRQIIGDAIWGVDDDTLEGIVGGLLTSKGLTLAVMEVSSAGVLATTISDVPSAGAYFKGGLLAFSPDAMLAYGVNADTIKKYGAISPEAAQEMAAVARAKLGANIGVAITGTVTPQEVVGSMVSMQPGTMYIGIASDWDKRVVEGRYPGGDRARLRRNATSAALFELRRTLLARG